MSGDVPILAAQDLSRTFIGNRARFGSRRARVQALSECNLRLSAGRTLGVVGESGCGKTTLSRLLLGIDQPTSGVVRFEGTDISAMSRQQRRAFRSSVQAVFQDPWSTLNPRMRVGTSVMEPLRALRDGSTPGEMARRVQEALESVGLEPDAARGYPHQFSGGQRQRIAIARAIITNPKVIVLDEPTSSLDASLRIQILDLLKRIQSETNVAYVLISHDLSTIRYLADDVAVLYLGSVVEFGQCDEVLDRPMHPYTAALRASATLDQAEMSRYRRVLDGDVPSSENIPTGCAFHTRCHLYDALGRPEACGTSSPPPLGSEGRQSACHFPHQMDGARS